MTPTLGPRVSAILSVGLFLLPAGSWTVITGFDKSLLVFLGLIFTYSTVPFEALLDPRLPDWLANPPGHYLLNLIPAVSMALAAYPILRKVTKLPRVEALFVACNASLLFLQMLGSLMLYFFVHQSGPYA